MRRLLLPLVSLLALALVTANRDSAAESGRSASPAADVEKVLSQLEREEREASQQLQVVARQSDAAAARALVRGRAYARLARAGFLPLGGGLRALVDHATRLERLRSGIQKDLSEQKRASVEHAGLTRRLEELRARILPLQVEQQALARAETALKSAEDREQAFQRAFQSSASEHTAIYGALGPADPLEVTAGFASMKGRLPIPITGRVEVKTARHEGGSGLELHAPEGTPVRAVYPGHVAFADSYADYGKTVIIDHGRRHYTVTANLGTVEVKVGDDVLLNTRLGTVGNTDRGAFAYIEIRAGSDTVAPAEWFGL